MADGNRTNPQICASEPYPIIFLHCYIYYSEKNIFCQRQFYANRIQIAGSASRPSISIIKRALKFKIFQSSFLITDIFIRFFQKKAYRLALSAHKKYGYQVFLHLKQWLFQGNRPPKQQLTFFRYIILPQLASLEPFPM